MDLGRGFPGLLGDMSFQHLFQRQMREEQAFADVSAIHQVLGELEILFRALSPIGYLFV
jgi:hypothetical protein